jgi:hypothetical protein
LHIFWLKLAILADSTLPALGYAILKGGAHQNSAANSFSWEPAQYCDRLPTGVLKRDNTIESEI